MLTIYEKIYKNEKSRKINENRYKNKKIISKIIYEKFMKKNDLESMKNR